MRKSRPNNHIQLNNQMENVKNINYFWQGKEEPEKLGDTIAK